MTDTEQTQIQVSGSTEVGKIMLKYAQRKAQASPEEAAHLAFERTGTSTRQVSKQQDQLETRVSRSPSTNNKEADSIHSRLYGIKMELAELADEYGALNVDFKNTVGKGAIYGVKDIAWLAWYTASLQKKKAKRLRFGAATKRDQSVNILIDGMAEILDKQYNKAIQGREAVGELQVQNISHMKFLDEQLISRLASSYRGSADITVVDGEIKSLEGELAAVDSALSEKEALLQQAKAKGDMNSVKQYASEMQEILGAKYQIMDGKFSLEGTVSNIRRELLESAEGVQSAKGATAASKVNYKAIGALIDSMNELEVKYKHALSDLIPVFKIQGQISYHGEDAMRMQRALLRTSEISQKLMEANAQMIEFVATDTFELMKKGLYDPEKALATERKLDEFVKDLNQKKVEWAEAVATVNQTGEAYHTRQR
jgi:hypothetical protein